MTETPKIRAFLVTPISSHGTTPQNRSIHVTPEGIVIPTNFGSFIKSSPFNSSSGSFRSTPIRAKLTEKSNNPSTPVAASQPDSPVTPGLNDEKSPRKHKGTLHSRSASQGILKKYSRFSNHSSEADLASSRLSSKVNGMSTPQKKVLHFKEI